MVKYADRFQGHVYDLDPRSLVTGALACTWPTMPAYRYRLFSTDATGAWAVWNFPGILVQLTTDIAEHDNAKWEMLSGPPRMEFVEWTKVPRADGEYGYRWGLKWKRTDDPLTLQDYLIQDPGRCNTDISLPNWSSGPSFPGSFGETAIARQVVFDQTMPPDYD